MADPDGDAAGEVELHRRTSANEADKLFRILFAAVQLGAPASKRQIAEQAGLSSQLVDYHVPKLVASGQLLLQAGRYRPQACLTDKNLFRLMKSSLIRQQLIEQVAAGLDFSQAENDEGAVIEENILSLLRLFTVELKKGRARPVLSMFRNLCISCADSSIPSSMLTSRMLAPPRTWSSATSSAVS